jgi:pyruvate-formate lyase-activating enzyme
VRVLLVSTYELGHQPLHIASPAGALRAAGHDVRALDLSVEDYDPALVDWAERAAFSVPMHTAMRLAVAAAERVTAQRPDLPVCFYGLYAGTGDAPGARIAGEYEPALLRWAGGGDAGDLVQLGRTSPAPPARDLLPPLERYARLAVGGEERLAGYVEATRGCSHRCAHCPVPVVYDGRVRVTAEPTVVEDVAQLAAMGARHITFGDPDFLNAPHHSLRVVREVHERFPELTFDCTTKVEHVLRHADLWPELAAAGCLFVVSALETLNDDILRRLDKGHTATEAGQAVDLLRRHGIETRPSFLPFTPWTTAQDVADILDFVVAHDMVGNVDPVQYTIRLLLPKGSLLLAHPDLQPHLGAYDPGRLSYGWSAAAPAMDALQAELAAVVEAAGDAAVGDAFERVASCVEAAAGAPIARPRGAVPARPRLTEPWFCCAEPTARQMAPVTQ